LQHAGIADLHLYLRQEIFPDTWWGKGHRRSDFRKSWRTVAVSSGQLTAAPVRKDSTTEKKVSPIQAMGRYAMIFVARAEEVDL